MKLSAAERERGWVIHSCTLHGDLAVTTPTATVYCGGKAEKGRRCNRRAILTNVTGPISRQDAYRIREAATASAKALHMKG